jgi:hypothetical protein
VGSDTIEFAESFSTVLGTIFGVFCVGFGWMGTAGREKVSSLAAGADAAAGSGWSARYAQKPPVLSATNVATTTSTRRIAEEPSN